MSQTVTKTLARARVGREQALEALRRALTEALRSRQRADLVPSLKAGTVRMYDGQKSADIVLTNAVLEALGLPFQRYADGVGLRVAADGEVTLVYDHTNDGTASALGKALPALLQAGLHWGHVAAAARMRGGAVDGLTIDWSTGAVQAHIRIGQGGAPLAQDAGEASPW